MRIKILSINQVLPDITGVGKQSQKPYSIKHWFCNIEVNGQVIQNIEVKIMDKNFNLELKEYEAEEKLFNNIKSYQIVKDKPTGTFNKWSKPVYTMREYDSLFQHAIKKIQGMEYLNSIDDKNVKADILCRLISTYIISATAGGVKIEEKKPEEKKEPDPNVNKVQQTFDTEESKGDDDIPW